ncbi:MAG: rhomboid family intramembrane serine protease [Verrucomicrobiota bacterium]
MRDPSPASARPMVFWLLAALVVAFVLQQITEIWFQSRFAWDHFALSATTVKTGQVWTLLSYGLMHGGVFHLLINGLLIFFLGRALESEFGGRRLLHLTLWGTLGGALLWLAINHQRSAQLAGASAAAMALLTVFACLNPRRPITLLLFFVLPVTLLPIWLLAIVGGIDVLGLLFREIPGGGRSGSIAHSAHLGGLAAGWLYYRFALSGDSPRTPWRGTAEIETPRWFRKARRTGLSEAPYKVDIRTTDDLRAEVDRILDKINSEGFGALTPTEKARLDEARDLLSKR